ncbi:MAG: YbgC/FadM family acyl-CoA thioesterase [bacterium]|nr:YbgC/FadM family acyl-CoA thioesterase [bacterium]MDT8364911.1 YbgC/FadM family acyl-CoA thioesterase [bacterium]
MKDSREHVSIVKYRTCYEDTDAGGVVYYANYLRYMERGRNQYLRELGRSIRQYQDAGILFIVVEVNVKYRSPAGLDDDLVIETWIQGGKRSSVTFGQRIKREGEEAILVEGTVKVACIGTNLKPRRMPEELL